MSYTHGIQWSKKKIIESILEVVKNLELDRMPSKKEVENYYKNCSLSNAIPRYTGSWYALADELGLKIKGSETYFGKTHEHIMAEKLSADGYEVVRMSQNFPYDLLVNNSIKIDVKVSRLFKGPNGNFYTFNMEKPFVTCDLLILLTLNDDNTIKDYYIIPSTFVYRNTQISIGEIKSKYQKFLNKWDYLEQYDNFFNNSVV